MKYALIIAIVALAASQVEAQVYYHAGYAPAPVVTYSPVVVAPVPVAVFPRTRVVYRPLVGAAPVVVQQSPVSTVIAPAPVAVQPVVTTRYRPFLGGTVSRVRYRYAPAVVVAPY